MRQSCGTAILPAWIWVAMLVASSYATDLPATLRPLVAVQSTKTTKPVAVAAPINVPVNGPAKAGAKAMATLSTLPAPPQHVQPLAKSIAVATAKPSAIKKTTAGKPVAKKGNVAAKGPGVSALRAAFMAMPPSIVPAQALTQAIAIALPENLQASLPANSVRADALYPVFEQPNLALRMEALRRASQSLSLEEKAKLWEYLNLRRDRNVDDPNLYFDVGYADIVLRMNKTGLFFLRKASERLRNPFASMAYAMAQADVDLYVEKGLPDTPSYRKLDVVYKLDDAIRLDVKQHQPGLWPTFVRIQQQLAKYPAYTDFSQRDYSDAFIPYGERPKLYVSSNLCKPMADGAEQPTITQSISLQPNGSQCLDFFPKSNQHYAIRVREGQRLLGQLESPVGLGIVEDIDGDGTFELVLRQYRIDPFKPVVVYRLTASSVVEPDPSLHKRWFE